MNGSTCGRRGTASSRSAACPNPSIGTIDGGRIRGWIGARRTRRISRRSPRWRPRPRNPMTRGCPEFVDNRLRRSPPDRASAVSRGPAGGNAARFPHLAHRPAVAHKPHGPAAATEDIDSEFDSGDHQNRQPGTGLSLFPPETCPNTRDRGTASLTRARGWAPARASDCGIGIRRDGGCRPGASGHVGARCVALGVARPSIYSENLGYFR
jgi:hypothetical protein